MFQLLNMFQLETSTVHQVEEESSRGRGEAHRVAQGGRRELSSSRGWRCLRGKTRAMQRRRARGRGRGGRSGARGLAAEVRGRRWPRLTRRRGSGSGGEGERGRGRDGEHGGAAMASAGRRKEGARVRVWRGGIEVHLAREGRRDQSN